MQVLIGGDNIYRVLSKERSALAYQNRTHLSPIFPLSSLLLFALLDTQVLYSSQKCIDNL